ncbi:MAG: hypothetical protein WBD23_04130 [Candidatus Acidiferrales bacterium]
MRRIRLPHLLAVALIVALALPALAAAKNKGPKPLAKGMFDIIDPAALGNTTLQPGRYTIVASDSAISFYDGGKKLVAQAPVQWKGLSAKVAQNAIVVDTGRITEVQFKGVRSSVVVQ